MQIRIVISARQDLGINSEFIYFNLRFRNDVPVDPSFRHDIKLDDEGYQTLTIKDAEPADAGIYKVKVSNTAGWASCDAKLYISCKFWNLIQTLLKLPFQQLHTVAVFFHSIKVISQL